MVVVTQSETDSLNKAYVFVTIDEDDDIIFGIRVVEDGDTTVDLDNVNDNELLALDQDTARKLADAIYFKLGLAVPPYATFS